MATDLGSIVRMTNAFVTRMQTLPSNTHPDRKGGYLLVALGGFFEQYLLQIGTFDPVKRERYHRFAQEKGHRLYADWLLDPTARSSWQTRKPEAQKYGGAVLFSIDTVCDIISFSGLNEHCDEALSLALGTQLRFTTDVERILEISGNPVYRELVNA